MHFTLPYLEENSPIFRGSAYASRPLISISFTIAKKHEKNTMKGKEVLKKSSKESEKVPNAILLRQKA